MTVQQTSQTVRFNAFYTSSGIGKTGLAPGSVLTVDVFYPNGTLYATAASPIEDGDGWYHYDVAGTYTTSAGTWLAVFKCTDGTVDQKHISDRAQIGPTWANNVDQAVSSRSTLSAASVWSYAARNLTDFGLTLSTPSSAPTVNVTGGGSTGGSLDSGAYYVKYTWINVTGETPPSPESSSFTVSAGNIPLVTIPSLPSGATAANIYLTISGGSSGTETLYATGISTTTTTLVNNQVSGNQPPPTVNSTVDLVSKVWTANSRTLTSFGYTVTVGANNDKTGYSLGVAGLDSLVVTDPGAIANQTTLTKMLVALYRYFFRQTTATSTQLKTYADDGATVDVTMTLSNDGTTQTKGAAT